jgi:hypothetical protein
MSQLLRFKSQDVVSVFALFLLQASSVSGQDQAHTRSTPPPDTGKTQTANTNTSPPSPLRSWADGCALALDKLTIVCDISEEAPQAVGPLKVDNSARVVIRLINKSPFDDCTLTDIKITEIKQQDPIVTILQLLTKGVTGAALPAALVTPEVEAEILNRPVRSRTPADKLYLDLRELLKRTKDSISKRDKDVTRYRDAAQLIDRMFSSPPRNTTVYQAQPAADLTVSHTVTVNEVRNVVQDLLSEDEQVLESEQIRLGLLRDRLKDVVTKGPQDVKDPGTDKVPMPEAIDPKSDKAFLPLDEEVIPLDEQLLNYVSGQISVLKADDDSISAARVQFRALLALFAQVDSAIKDPSKTTNPFQKDLPVLPFTQQTASTAVVCSNSFTKKASTPQISVIVAYQKNPALSVSVGPLLSTIEKQKLGITPISTGVDGTGKPTFKLIFAVVDHAPVQVVPFAFLNYRFCEFGNKANPAKKKPISLNASVGVGVNPNSGTNEPEFFVGPSVGLRSLLIQFGDHIGRFQEGFTGGFKIGDTVPTGFPTSLPIHKVYRNGFGVALSYRLPL